MVDDRAIPNVESVGKVVDSVAVSIGPQFLERFSEHMYSSPNKAFEELVSNSWDAGAETVYIGMPDDLSAENASVWVLDDGESMDIAGLHALWAVATSTKRNQKPVNGRAPIGKFGLGKLATYLLARQLTYICRSSDGVVRAVTMDYKKIQDAPEGSLHIDPIKLDVREIDAQELQDLLFEFADGEEILRLIKEGVPRPSPLSGLYDDEFGGIDSLPDSPARKTWTLALLSLLRPAGEEMQEGRIQWLLRTALPLGSSMAVVFNGSQLTSSKIDVEVTKDWVLGASLGITSVTLPNGDICAVSEKQHPYPHICIEGIDGVITGTVRLYRDKISGGKSDLYGSSNGFLVNILGRVINPLDPYFGLENLNHSSWAKFRATIRADGLDDQLSVNRESLRESTELTIFRAFLRTLFNKSRTIHDQENRAAWQKAGEDLAKSWSAVPLEPLMRVVSEGLTSASGLPEFIENLEGNDPETLLEEWERVSKDQPGDLITDVVLELLSTSEPLVKYELTKRKVVVNRNHPFSREYIQSHEEQLLLRDMALVDLLTDAFMVDIGINDGQLREVREYRDQILRLIAQIHRRTGVQIAELLLKATSNAKGLEHIVGDALEYLGFDVERLAQSGQPEGVATAPATPDHRDRPASYSLTYDAKSSAKGKVKTKDLNLAGLARHRRNHGADYTLVIAPDYESGALEDDCSKQMVTPMRAEDLAAILMLAATRGPISMIDFRTVFELFDPDQVHQWVEALVAKLSKRKGLSLDLFLRALSSIGYTGPNAVNVSVIADRINLLPDVDFYPNRSDVRNLVTGLSVLVPHLVRRSGDNVYLSASPDKLRSALVAQINQIPPQYRFGLDSRLGA